MSDLEDGESIEVQGSGRSPYVLKNTGGVYSCTCPAWRNQSLGIERRTCKHLRALRGAEAEAERTGGAAPAAVPTKQSGDSTAPALLLAETFAYDIDPAGWWLSEKLDGVRAYWTGSEFRSRLGSVFHAPPWFTAGLPPTPLDGELWLARKQFQRTVSIVRRQDQSNLWQEIRYLVFDVPAVNAGFEERLRYLTDCFAQHQPKYAQQHEHQTCRGLAHLEEEVQRIVALGGEGLMLREPGSRYQAGRSASLLKVKQFHDAEARVIEHLPGGGRHKGRLGALLVELPDGTQFSVGTGFSDQQRENPPAAGSLITFRYQELSDRGVPRFPTFVRLRRDGQAQTSDTRGMESTSAGAASRDDKKKSTSRTAKSSATTTAEPSHDQPPLSPKGSTGMTRRFEYVGGNSEKFWEITVAGTDVTVCFGRVGTKGQTQTKSFADSAAADKHTEKLIAEKLAKGYQATAPN